MYEIHATSRKTDKILRDYISKRGDIRDKLIRLKINPRRGLGAHPLHGRFFGKWACWLGSNIRMIYSIDDKSKLILIFAVGAHNIY